MAVLLYSNQTGNTALCQRLTFKKPVLLMLHCAVSSAPAKKPAFQPNCVKWNSTKNPLQNANANMPQPLSASPKNCKKNKKHSTENGFATSCCSHSTEAR